MTDPTITDLRRELEKAQIALIAALKHLGAHAEMNAALHCADRVMYSPLHAKIESTIGGIDHALNRTKPAVTVTEWALEHSDAHCLWRTLLTDLDRCQHGRHEGDGCGPADACTGTSAGNPHLRPGDVIGYGLRADHIVMPDRDHKHNVAAWRVQPGEEPQR
ncbi:hypothetical protein O3Q52_36220 [Streptomyces sp. ActVer]|uniref:hypothetical protein n=1 Tax=Streptomyces sp. ActVer TaxID=3014558 RepID=UPI0022B56441|nr:hypothetical protein [Streptomyces sp. ActVer]MCZ4513501.1 hypothetical protein [Streptomyces sp. ActVer]